MVTPALGREMDDVRALGHGAVGLINGAILLAIVAVILAGPQTADMIKSFFTLVTWLVGQVISPVTGGTQIQWSTQPGSAGAGSLGTGPTYAPGQLPGMSPGTTSPPFLWPSPGDTPGEGPLA